MEFENTQNNALAKLPMLKLGEYEMWEIRIKQYFQIQDYALWEVIENGNSWVPIPETTPPESGTSTTIKMTVPATIEEKTCKKNDVKARSLLLMALPNEHQLTFDQYVDAQSMFAAIKARFGGNEATKKTQKALLKQQYENFSASSSESLDSIFNRLQKLVSRLAILGVVTPPEDLNVKFLRSLPSEWDTHVVVWMNKPDFDTMGLDDLYNNFKIVEQKVKKSAGASNDDKNLAFVTTSGASSTNNINTVNPEVSTATTKVNTASTEICTASFSDATVYAFLSTQPKGSQLVHEDLEQLHDDDLEEMDLKWNMALLSMRARKFYQRTGRKIIIDGSNTAGYDKSKVECFNCHKMGHFARECRAPRSKDNRNWNQGSSTKTVKIEDASEKAMCAIDGAGFDWSDMAEEEIQANMALISFSDSEVNKSCSKTCLTNYEALKKQYDDLLVKLSDTGFKAAAYKRGLATLEDQIYGPRDSSLKPTTGYDKESDNSKENTDDSLEQHQMTDTETSSFESPLKVDKDWKEKFFYPANHVESVNQIEKPVKRTVRYADKSLVKEQESQVKSSFVEGCGSNTSKNVSEVEPKKVRKNNDAPIIEDWVLDDEEQDGSKTKPEKKTVIPTAAKIEKPVRKPVKYAEMYRSQRPRGNKRNWNGQKSNQLRCNFCTQTYGSKGSLNEDWPKIFNIARPVNTVRSVNTSRPFSTARSFNTVRPFYTAHPKSTIHCARPRTYFQNQAQSTVHRPFYKRTALTKRCFNQRFNTGRPFRSTVNTVRARGFNAVKPSACWVWRPIKPNGAGAHWFFNKYNYIDAQGRSKHQELTSPEQTATGKDFSNPLIVYSKLYGYQCTMFYNEALASPKQTAIGKDYSNPLMAEIFEQLALMGYQTDSDKLTFQKGDFSPQWRIGVLKDDLKRTKQTYSVTFTKLILRIKKLEFKVKTGKARKRARVVLSEDEEDDSFLNRVRKTNQQDSTAGIEISTAPINDNTASESLSTAERLGLEEVIRLQEQVDEEERAQIARDEEIARQLLALDEERANS
ncbi:putative ribonuclease H-like domain-containing protein [Tanacetum coccineum]